MKSVAFCENDHVNLYKIDDLPHSFSAWAANKIYFCINSECLYVYTHIYVCTYIQDFHILYVYVYTKNEKIHLLAKSTPDSKINVYMGKTPGQTDLFIFGIFLFFTLSLSLSSFAFVWHTKWVCGGISFCRWHAFPTHAVNC